MGMGTKMLWIYRIVAIGLVGFGSYLMLFRPSDDMSGLAFLLALPLFLLPGAVNLINGFWGERFTAVRWVTILVNGGYVVVGCWPVAVDAGFSPVVLLFIAPYLILLAFSVAFGISWSRASGKAEGVG